MDKKQWQPELACIAPASFTHTHIALGVGPIVTISLEKCCFDDNFSIGAAASETSAVTFQDITRLFQSGYAAFCDWPAHWHAHCFIILSNESNQGSLKRGFFTP